MAKVWRVLAVLAVVLSAHQSCGEDFERTLSSKPRQSGPKVGIVGAGVGGAISAFLLRRLLGPKAEIFVYASPVENMQLGFVERTALTLSVPVPYSLAHGPVGGRTQTFTYDDQVQVSHISNLFWHACWATLSTSHHLPAELRFPDPSWRLTIAWRLVETLAGCGYLPLSKHASA